MEQKRRQYELMAEVLKACAHPDRLAILECIAGGERCVNEIAEAVGVERTSTSRHLALMLKVGVVANRKESLQVFYRVRTPCLLNVLGCVYNALCQQVQENRLVLGEGR